MVLVNITDDVVNVHIPQEMNEYSMVCHIVESAAVVVEYARRCGCSPGYLRRWVKRNWTIHPEDFDEVIRATCDAMRRVLKCESCAIVIDTELRGYGICGTLHPTCMNRLRCAFQN
jgi:hypothetical protein